MPSRDCKGAVVESPFPLPDSRGLFSEELRMPPGGTTEDENADPPLKGGAGDVPLARTAFQQDPQQRAAAALSMADFRRRIRVNG